MPLILAHRGANKRAPQNTLPAFKIACDLLADGIETDVHLCKDNKIVICHNYTIDATSNGSGLIDEMTFDELRKYDFGSYFSEEYKGVTLPTLDELLEVVKGMNYINIEIKPPQKNNDLVKRTIDEVNRFGIADKTIISCFDPECIRLSKELDPNIKTGLLYEEGDLGNEIMSFGVARFCKQLNADAAHPHRTLITLKEISELHNLGMEVNPWTVNTKEDILKFTEWGCDCLISDIPDYCRKVLEENK